MFDLLATIVETFSLPILGGVFRAQTSGGNGNGDGDGNENGGGNGNGGGKH